jgi:organic hydroperoxide reductase OsmC/OhrA
LSLHRASVDWRLEGDFAARRYSRAHTLSFDGVEVRGGAAAAVVGPRYAVERSVDPEQMFTASVSACHMLWFLDFAARAGFVAASYHDDAEGLLGVGPDGRQMVTRVWLKPRVRFEGDRTPTEGELAALHDKAHDACFIANSVRTEVLVEPVAAVAAAPNPAPP